MKRFAALLTALCATLLTVTSCDWFSPREKDRQVLLIYFAGNNSLTQEGQGDFEDLRGAWLPGQKETDKIVLVYHHFMDRTPALVRLSRDKKGVLVEETIQEYPFSTNSATKETLSAVLNDAEEAWPATRRSLILWSHATGYLPAGYYSDPKDQEPKGPVQWSVPGNTLENDPYAHMVKSFAEDHGTEMELADLRSALSSRHYEFVLFDCCFMADVEVAYELRNVCDYLLFSPTEILSDGFPYETMVQPVFTQKPEEALRTIAQNFMAHYRAMSGVYCSATVSVVRTAGLEPLAAACRPIFQNHQDQILTINRSSIQAYHRFSNQYWFYDLDDFVGRVASDAEYATFLSALHGAVIFKDATDSFLGLTIKHYSGLGSYIPRPSYTVLNNYYKTLQWNKATGLVQ